MIVAGGSAIPRLIDFAAFREIADEVGAIFCGRRRALHRPGRRQGDPEPGALRRRRHLHHAQGAARPARRDVRLQGRARREDGQGGVPDDAGRPAHARGRGQGGQPAGVPAAGVPGLRPRRSSPTPRRWPTALAARGHPPDHRRHRHPPGAARPAGRRRDRPRRRGPLRRRRHRAEQERHPVRPAAAEHRLRHPGRHAGGHHAGHGHGRDGDRSPT